MPPEVEGSTSREYFMKTYGASEKDVSGLLGQISHIESLNKNVAQSGGGPGRGYFQFETKQGSGAFQTALNRMEGLYKTQGQKMPSWAVSARGEDNPMSLSRSQQEEVLLADLSMKKGSDPLIKDALKTGSAKNLWLQKHWAGAGVGTPDYLKKGGQWDKNIGGWGETMGVDNAMRTMNRTSPESPIFKTR
jgi:hypothetical protein